MNEDEVKLWRETAEILGHDFTDEHNVPIETCNFCNINLYDNRARSRCDISARFAEAKRHGTLSVGKFYKQRQSMDINEILNLPLPHEARQYVLSQHELVTALCRELKVQSAEELLDAIRKLTSKERKGGGN